MNDFEFKLIQELGKMNSCFEKIYTQMDIIKQSTSTMANLMEKSFKDNADPFVEVKQP